LNPAIELTVRDCCLARSSQLRTPLNSGFSP
jgi:hypothetical protein